MLPRNRSGVGAADSPCQRSKSCFRRSHTLRNPLDRPGRSFDPAVAQGCAEAIASQTMWACSSSPGCADRAGVQQATATPSCLKPSGGEQLRRKSRSLRYLTFRINPHPALQDVADKAKIPYLRGPEGGSRDLPLRDVVDEARAVACRGLGQGRGGGKSRLDVVPSHRLAAEHEARDILRSYGRSWPSGNNFLPP